MDKKSQGKSTKKTDEIAYIHSPVGTWGLNVQTLNSEIMTE
jgi:hypothetical protein